MLLIGIVFSLNTANAFATQEKCSSGLTARNIKAITCQGLQRHPFHRKDLVESLVGGTAKIRIYLLKDIRSIFITDIIAADHFIPLFGLTPKLGPIADWGLDVIQSAIPVNPADYSTNIARIHAVGDINTYPGKLKLILCGFHEAALAMQSAFKYVYPEEKLSFKYTTVYGINTF